MATRAGWIRVRHYLRPRNYWSLQFSDWGQVEDTIRKFVTGQLSTGRMSEHDELRLSSLTGAFHVMRSARNLLEEEEGNSETCGYPAVDSDTTVG